MSAFTVSTTDLGHSKPAADPVSPEGLPLGNHQWVVPHPGTFNGYINPVNKTYSQRFDEAMLHSRENAWRMRLDPMIDACLERRVTSSSLLAFSVKPEDDDDPQQVAAAKRQEGLLRRLPRFVELKRWLLKEGLFVGRSGAQMLYEWTRLDNRLMCRPFDFRPINGDKLQFAWDGSVGITVSSNASVRNSEQVRHLDGSPCYFVSPTERAGLVVHRSFSEDHDFYRPIMGGAIHGTGLRGKLYWLWALKSQLWGMSIDFLRWFAKGLTVYYFEHGNAAHFEAVKQWVERQDGNDAMFYPIFRDMPNNEPYLQKPLERFEVSTASPQFLQKLITEYLDDLIRFTILHQSLTTSTAPTGLGSGVAQAHQTTYDELTALDCSLLDDTITADILFHMYRVNEPGIPPGRFVSNVDKPNVQQMVEGAQAIVAMGGSVAQKPLTEAIGLPEPKQDDTLLGGPQPGQPAAVGAVPDGTPVATASDDPNQPPVG